MKLAERNCILVDTPKDCAQLIIETVGLEASSINMYEPGFGRGNFMLAMLLQGVRSVCGIEQDHAMVQAAKSNLWAYRSRVDFLEHENMLPFVIPRGVNLVYCYLMHGLTELLFAKTILENNADPCYFVSHNYPLVLPLGPDTLQPNKTITQYHNWAEYPPYSQLYIYEITPHLRTCFVAVSRKILAEFRKNSVDGPLELKRKIYCGSRSHCP